LDPLQFMPQLCYLTGKFSFPVSFQSLILDIHFAAQNMESTNQTVALTKSQCLGDMMV